jgi:hypothetical protein
MFKDSRWWVSIRTKCSRLFVARREKIEHCWRRWSLRACGWSKITSGGTDWKKANALGASVGVEVQVSGRSDMVAMDIMHLSEDISSGLIDVGIIIVPDNVLSRFLTDRTPNFATAIKHAERWAPDLPLRVVGFRHDSAGDALAKMRNLGRD